MPTMRVFVHFREVDMELVYPRFNLQPYGRSSLSLCYDLALKHSSRTPTENLHSGKAEQEMLFSYTALVKALFVVTPQQRCESFTIIINILNDLYAPTPRTRTLEELSIHSSKSSGPLLFSPCDLLSPSKHPSPSTSGTIDHTAGLLFSALLCKARGKQKPLCPESAAFRNQGQKVNSAN